MRRRLIGGEGARAARRRRWQSLREKRRRGIFLLPSLLTTANLFSGFLAVLLTANGRYADAAVAILAAILLDILDGKVARLTNTTTQFGLEFDSLADVVSFCVAPAFLLYAWALSQLGRAAWPAAAGGRGTGGRLGALPGGRGDRALGTARHQRCHVRRGRADGLHLPLLELQGGGFLPAPSAGDPAAGRARGAYRRHVPPALPLPPVRAVRPLRARAPPLGAQAG